MEGSRVKLTEVNPHLVCVLCHGYFVDATTIAECLHSFCRSCIFRYLQRKSYCPICEVQVHNTKLYLSLKPDKTLQDIVYKLVPGLFHNEMQRRRDFYKEHPHRDEHLESECRGVGLDRLIYSPDDMISLSLEFYDLEREREEWSNTTTSLAPVTQESVPGTKRYLQCPAGFKMAHLKKFLRQKYNLPSTCPVEIMYRRESLPDSYSLMDVAYIYTWKRNGPMRFYYRLPEVAEKKSEEDADTAEETATKEDKGVVVDKKEEEKEEEKKEKEENKEEQKAKENCLSASNVSTQGPDSGTVPGGGRTLNKHDEISVSALLSLGRAPPPSAAPKPRPSLNKIASELAGRREAANMSDAARMPPPPVPPPHKTPPSPVVNGLGPKPPPPPPPQTNGTVHKPSTPPKAASPKPSPSPPEPKAVDSPPLKGPSPKVSSLPGQTKPSSKPPPPPAQTNGAIAKQVPPPKPPPPVQSKPPAQVASPPAAQLNGTRPPSTPPQTNGTSPKAGGVQNGFGPKPSPPPVLTNGAQKPSPGPKSLRVGGEAGKPEIVLNTSDGSLTITAQGEEAKKPGVKSGGGHSLTITPEAAIHQSNVNTRLPTFPKPGRERRGPVGQGPTLDQRIQQLYKSQSQGAVKSPGPELSRQESRLAHWLNSRFPPAKSSSPPRPKEQAPPPSKVNAEKLDKEVSMLKRKLEELRRNQDALCEITQENPDPEEKRRRQVRPDVSIELMRAADLNKEFTIQSKEQMCGSSVKVQSKKRPVPGLKAIQELPNRKPSEDEPRAKKGKTEGEGGGTGGPLDLSKHPPGPPLRLPPPLPWLLASRPSLHPPYLPTGK